MGLRGSGVEVRLGLAGGGALTPAIPRRSGPASAASPGSAARPGTRGRGARVGQRPGPQGPRSAPASRPVSARGKGSSALYQRLLLLLRARPAFPLSSFSFPSSSPSPSFPPSPPASPLTPPRRPRAWSRRPSEPTAAEVARRAHFLYRADRRSPAGPRGRAGRGRRRLAHRRLQCPLPVAPSLGPSRRSLAPSPPDRGPRRGRGWLTVGSKKGSGRGSGPAAPPPTRGETLAPQFFTLFARDTMNKPSAFKYGSTFAGPFIM